MPVVANGVETGHERPHQVEIPDDCEVGRNRPQVDNGIALGDCQSSCSGSLLSTLGANTSEVEPRSCLSVCP